jgi:hypothetical protein
VREGDRRVSIGKNNHVKLTPGSSLNRRVFMFRDGTCILSSWTLFPNSAHSLCFSLSLSLSLSFSFSFRTWSKKVHDALRVRQGVTSESELLKNVTVEALMRANDLLFLI